MHTDKMRYQDCPWWVRLWRRRHYIPIPFRAARLYLAMLRAPARYVDLPKDMAPEQKMKYGWAADATQTLMPRFGWSMAWGIACGEADVRMNWWYSSEEVGFELAS